VGWRKARVAANTRVLERTQQARIWSYAARQNLECIYLECIHKEEFTKDQSSSTCGRHVAHQLRP
jgi:hypothetical protein